MYFLRLRPETAPLFPPGAAPTFTTIFDEAEARKSAAVASALSVGEASSTVFQSTRKTSGSPSTKTTPPDSLPKSSLQTTPEVDPQPESANLQSTTPRQSDREARPMSIVRRNIFNAVSADGSKRSSGIVPPTQRQTQTEKEEKCTADIAASLALGDGGGVENVLDVDVDGVGGMVEEGWD